MIDRMLQERLRAFNQTRLRPRLEEPAGDHALREEFRCRRLEREFFARERAQIAARAAVVPRRAEEFVAWFEELEHEGPGQGDVLFDWLAEEASLPEMKWFLAQEVAGEAGFEDLVALTQLQMPTRAKLELARNYWDEMGRGHRSGMHGPLLSHLARSLELPRVDTVVESVALGNLMLALACNRAWAFQSLGALGVIELTAPGRAEKVNAGLKRLGVPGDVRRYFALHATLDRQHSSAWNQEILLPLVAEEPRLAPALAEGALLRLEAGRRCFVRYRQELWGAAFLSRPSRRGEPRRPSIEPSPSPGGRWSRARAS